METVAENSVKRPGRPKDSRKAKIPRRALCLSIEGLASRAENGDTRAQELLVESVMHLERFLKAS